VEGGIYKGLVPDGGLSNDGNMQLRGTAEPNSIVYICNAYNNAVLDTVKTDANGNWIWDRAVADTAAGRPHMFYTIAKDDLVTFQVSLRLIRSTWIPLIPRR
jgi:hypothetical protein